MPFVADDAWLDDVAWNPRLAHYVEERFYKQAARRGASKAIAALVGILVSYLVFGWQLPRTAVASRWWCSACVPLWADAAAALVALRKPVRGQGRPSS